MSLGLREIKKLIRMCEYGSIIFKMKCGDYIIYNPFMATRVGVGMLDRIKKGTMIVKDKAYTNMEVSLESIMIMPMKINPLYDTKVSYCDNRLYSYEGEYFPIGEEVRNLNMGILSKITPLEEIKNEYTNNVIEKLVYLAEYTFVTKGKIGYGSQCEFSKEISELRRVFNQY